MQSVIILTHVIKSDDSNCTSQGIIHCNKGRQFALFLSSIYNLPLSFLQIWGSDWETFTKIHQIQAVNKRKKERDKGGCKKCTCKKDTKDTHYSVIRALTGAQRHLISWLEQWKWKHLNRKSRKVMKGPFIRKLCRLMTGATLHRVYSSISSHRSRRANACPRSHTERGPASIDALTAGCICFAIPERCEIEISWYGYSTDNCSAADLRSFSTKSQQPNDRRSSKWLTSRGAGRSSLFEKDASWRTRRWGSSEGQQRVREAEAEFEGGSRSQLSSMWRSKSDRRVSRSFRVKPGGGKRMGRIAPVTGSTRGISSARGKEEEDLSFV